MNDRIWITLAIYAYVLALFIAVAGCTSLACRFDPPSDCPEPPDMERVPDADPDGSDCRDRATGRWISERCCACYLAEGGES